MEIIISNTTRITDLTVQEMDRIKDEMTISNPLFFKKQEMDLYVWDTPQHFKYYEMPFKGCIEIPVGATSDVLDILKEEFGRLILPTDIKDKRVEITDNPFFKGVEFTGSLRDYQKDVETSCLDKTIGVVQALTGSGKTINFTSLIVKRKQPTLVLVNKIDLANQTIDAIANFTNIDRSEIGYLGSGEFNLKPISVGIHQSLASYGEEEFKKINETFSQIIADEVHIIAADTFYQNMNKLTAKYKYGFSSTPTREDGLTKVIHFATGPIIHKVPEKALSKYLTVPTYKQVETDYHYFLPNTQDYQIMLNDMAEDEERNELIIKDCLKHNQYYSCLLCARTSQVEYLAEQLGDEAIGITSKISKKKRKELMKDVKSKKYKFVIATYGLMSTGIDVPFFERLLLCAPISSEIKIKQSIGRLMRQAEGKTGAEVIDFVDLNIGLLIYQAKKRKKIIETLLKKLNGA